MTAVLLLVLGVVGPIPIPAPTSIDDSCDPAKLAPMMSAPAEQIPSLMGDVDRRIQIALAEERRYEKLIADSAHDPAAQRERTLFHAALITLLAAFAVSLFAARRSRGLLAASLAIAVGAGAFGATRMLRIHEAEHQQFEQMQRALALGACHLRLTETRSLLQHSQLSRCIYNLDEADEDVSSWVSKLKTGQLLTVEEVTKLHNEMRAALK